MCQISEGDDWALLCTNFSLPQIFYTEFKGKDDMLLFLIILITLLVLLFLCSSSLLVNYLDMAWLRRVTVFWLFWTSQLRRAHRWRQRAWTNNTIDETFEFFFSTERNVLCAELKNKVFSLGEPPLHLLPLLLLKRERCTDVREKFYICNRGDCFVCTTWVLKSFRLFRNLNPDLVTYLLTYYGTFLILKSN